LRFGYGHRVPTALLSVYDKTGVVDLARTLHQLGWTLRSSGGTARAIAEAGVPVTDVAELTGFPAILGHRVVTLHPKVHGGILADPTDPAHRADLDEYGIEPISLVVVNLYPFSSEPGIELIDVGGPAMVRAAAKNHAHVGVVVDPADYGTRGRRAPRPRGVVGRDPTPPRPRRVRPHRRLRRSDRDLVRRDRTRPEPLPPSSIHLALERAQILRYGENPHQVGARYRTVDASWWDTMVQHGGKALSYLNLYDTEAAWRPRHRFDEPAA
jgi:phosphoribosylaminoimidazolecarboxamide formyltransferase / IMP cyclohydrolase